MCALPLGITVCTPAHASAFPLRLHCLPTCFCLSRRPLSTERPSGTSTCTLVLTQHEARSSFRSPWLSVGFSLTQRSLGPAPATYSCVHRSIHMSRHRRADLREPDFLTGVQWWGGGWPLGWPLPCPPGSGWEGSCLSGCCTEAATGTQTRSSRPLLHQPPGVTPPRCLWQQIVLIFSINRAKALSKSDL